MQRNAWKKIVIIAVLLLSVGGIIFYTLYHPQHSAIYTDPETKLTIAPFNEKNDLDEVIQLFEHDWYMLSNRDYDKERQIWMLKTGSPNEYEPRYFGKMRIAVARDNGKFAGFITYYMKNFKEGIVLFLAVHQDFRGKRYGQKLLDYAQQELKKMGAEEVSLVARVNNESGNKLYNRAGFTQSPDVDPEFYSFRKKA